MGCLGNVIWFLCGGVILGLSWLLTGCLWCITIIGIPVGMQCFKFAALSFFPFGKEITYGGGAGSLLLNIIWLLDSRDFHLQLSQRCWDVCYVLQLSESRLDCSILKLPS